MISWWYVAALIVAAASVFFIGLGIVGFSTLNDPASKQKGLTAGDAGAMLGVGGFIALIATGLALIGFYSAHQRLPML